MKEKMDRYTKVKQLHTDLPIEVHKAFKRMSGKRRTTMTAVIQELVSQWMSDNSSARQEYFSLDDDVRDWIDMRTLPF